MEKKDAAFIEKINRELENQIKRCGKAFTGIPNRVETSLAEVLEHEFAPRRDRFRTKSIGRFFKRRRRLGESSSLTDFKIVVDCFNEAIDNVKRKFERRARKITISGRTSSYRARTRTKRREYSLRMSLIRFGKKDVPYLIDQLERAKLPRPPVDSSENNKNFLKPYLDTFQCWKTRIHRRRETTSPTRWI